MPASDVAYAITTGDAEVESLGIDPGTIEDPELRSEREYLNLAHESLSAMRARAETLLHDLRSAGQPDLDYKGGRLALGSRLIGLLRQRLRAAGRREADDRRDSHRAGVAEPVARQGEARGDAGLDDDLPLLDEAEYLTNGRTRTYGHVVVDEAQDLSPMQFRMVARRAPSGSLTILGNPAQATGPWDYRTWDEILRHLPDTSVSRRDELTLGYRAPGQILDLASKLLSRGCAHRAVDPVHPPGTAGAPHHAGGPAQAVCRERARGDEIGGRRAPRGVEVSAVIWPK